MKKINKITAAIFTAMLSGNVYAFQANVISYVSGETIVQNGDMVSYNGECFIAKNSPGIWESPSADSWFWTLTECSDEPGPNPNPNPDPEPEVTELSILSPTAGQLLKVDESVAIQARIDGELASKVEFWINDTKLAEKAID